jgi:hypothetical protein
MAQFKTAKLNDEQAEAYETFLKEKELASEAFSHDRAKKTALKTLLDGFGELDFARLPDGRVIQRTEKSRTVRASEERKDTWYELNEVQL